MAVLKAQEYQRFEDIKHTTDEGMEFWYARELGSVLDYAKWDNFRKVIDKAMLACKNSGFEVENHFPEIGKMIKFLRQDRLLKMPHLYMDSDSISRWGIFV